MKAIATIGLAACVAAVPRAQSGVSSGAFNELGLFHDKKAEDLFTQARIAITGGPGGLARLQGLRLKGRSKIGNSDGSTAFEGMVEILIQLPDKYLRIDSGNFGRRLTGYAGSTPLTLIEDSDRKIVSEPRDAATVTIARFELARFMLGAATWTSHEVKVKLYTRDAPADMPGAADPLGVDAVGSDDSGFAARVVMDAKSRMPARVVYRSGDGIRTLSIVERKSVGGYKLPSHVVTTIGDRLVDDLTFDDVAVNPRFDKADFTK
jgi:hypothetical protein